MRHGHLADSTLRRVSGAGGLYPRWVVMSQAHESKNTPPADALVTADIACDAVLYQQYTPRGAGLAELLDMGGTDPDRDPSGDWDDRRSGE